MEDYKNLQALFDILGEILKFNKRTIILFETSISEQEFNLIWEKAKESIIYSHGFIRSLAVSLNKFNSVFDL